MDGMKSKKTSNLVNSLVMAYGSVNHIRLFSAIIIAFTSFHSTLPTLLQYVYSLLAFGLFSVSAVFICALQEQ